MKWDVDAEREFWRRICYDSFYWFFRYGWGYDFNPKGAGGPKPWFADESHKAACDWFEKHALQWVADRRAGLNKPCKLICVVPRDWGKTTLFAQAGQAWLHLHDPDLATYTGCETMTRAREILSGIKSVISGDDVYSRYAWLYGSERRPNRTWKLDNIVTASRTNLTRRDASYGTWAVETGMVGLHPDAAFFDDPNSYEKMRSKGDWLEMVCEHLATLIPVFQSDALWMLTATRYGDGDHIGRSVKYEGVQTMTGMHMPGVEQLDPDGTWHVFFMDAVDGPDDETDPLVMPKIWSRERIRTFKRLNATRYFSQVRNNPMRSPHNVLRLDDAKKLIKPAADYDVKKLRISLHMDTAFKTIQRKARGDANVISVVGHMTDGSGRCVFLELRKSTMWESEEFAENLLDLVKYWRARALRVSCMTDEADFGGKPGLWTALLENKFKTAGIPMPTFHVLPRPLLSKQQRLAEAAALWKDGRMVLLENAPGLDTLLYEMTNIGLSEYDDCADATGDCFHHLVYTTVHSTGKIELAHARNPFDDVLKPGPLGDAAAEKIAKMYDEAEQMLAAEARFDIIYPS